MTNGIKCGSCHGRHDTVAQVRLCYVNKARAQAQQPLVVFPPPVVEDYSTTPEYTRDIQQREREDDERAYAAKAARDEELEAAQRLDAMTGKPGRDMASDKQVKYVMDLLAQHQWPDQITEDAVRNMERRQVSKLIESLKQSPRRSDPIDVYHGQGPEVGVYRAISEDDKVLVRVYMGQKSGRNLVKRVDGPGDYAYIGSALSMVQGRTSLGKVKLEKVTLAEAMEWGQQQDTKGHTYCLLCGRRLDVPESVDRGIGPVCATKDGAWA